MFLQSESILIKPMFTHLIELGNELQSIRTDLPMYRYIRINIPRKINPDTRKISFFRFPLKLTT